MLMGIFGLTVVVMIVAVVRVAVVYSKSKTPDLSWLFFWGSIEMATSERKPFPFLNVSVVDAFHAAIIIACVASFRQLFITTQNQHQYRKTSDSTSRRGLLSYLRLSSKTSNHSISRVMKRLNISNNDDNMGDKLDSQAKIFPPHGIHVSQDIEISHTYGGQQDKLEPRDLNRLQ